jgi:hypothetical protein
MDTTEVVDEPATEETTMDRKTPVSTTASLPDGGKIRAALRSNLLYRHYLEPILGQRPAHAR